MKRGGRIKAVAFCLAAWLRLVSEDGLFFTVRPRWMRPQYLGRAWSLELLAGVRRIRVSQGSVLLAL
jgi:hypothetical protein